MVFSGIVRRSARLRGHGGCAGTGGDARTKSAAVLLNAALNGLAVEFREGSPLGGPLPGVEVVLAGDVFYERALAEGALAWFRALARGGIRVLAGDADRVYAPRDGFSVVALHDVPTTVEIEDRPIRRARVLEILPGPP